MASGGTMNTLGQIFGGPSDPRLSEAQNRQAQQQAMLLAGLQGLLASQSAPGMPAPGLLQIAAQSILTGQQAGGAFRQQALEQAAQQQLAEMVRSTPPEQLPALAQRLVAEGRLDEAKQITDLIRAMPQPGADRSLMEVRVGDEVHLVNRVTGETVRTLSPSEAARERAAAEEQARAADEAFRRGQQLATSFRTDLSEHQQVANAYGTVLAAAQDPSAAGDLALIFAYMRMLDPGSVVREGEFATAQNAPGVPERVRAQYNRILSGERFTPEARADFLDRARRLAQQRQKQVQPILRRYRERARRAGVDPSLFVFDPFVEVGLPDLSANAPTGATQGEAGLFSDLVPGGGGQ